MNKHWRLSLYSLCYTFLFAVVPLLIWLRFFGDKAERLFIYYLIIIFLTLGYMLFFLFFKDGASREDKQFNEKLGDIEIQNAAIAFSLSELKKEIRSDKDKFDQ